MKIIVDAFGGDNAPLAPIQGAIEAHDEYGVDIILTGDEATIQRTAADNNLSLNGITIVHAPDVFTNDDHLRIIRSVQMKLPYIRRSLGLFCFLVKQIKTRKTDKNGSVDISSA